MLGGNWKIATAPQCHIWRVLCRATVGNELMMAINSARNGTFYPPHFAIEMKTTALANLTEF